MKIQGNICQNQAIAAVVSPKWWTAVLSIASVIGTMPTSPYSIILPRYQRTPQTRTAASALMKYIAIPCPREVIRPSPKRVCQSAALLLILPIVLEILRHPLLEAKYRFRQSSFLILIPCPFLHRHRFSRRDPFPCPRASPAPSR